MKKRFIIAAVVTLFSAMLLTGCGEKEINLNDYISYEFDGVDGHGTVYTNIDEDRVIEDIALATNKTDEETLSLYMFTDELYRSVEWSEDENLSNGDKITLHFTITDPKKIDGIVLKYKDIDETVQGLLEVEEFDPFEGLNVSFHGVSGEATIEIEGNEGNGIYYEPTKYSNIAEGDSITVTAYFGTLEDYALEYGKVPTVTEKEYQAVGLDTYTLTEDLFTSGSMDSLMLVAKNEINKFCEDSFAYQLKDAKILTSDDDILAGYELVLKDNLEVYELAAGNSKESGNYIYMIVSAQCDCNKVSHWNGDPRDEHLFDGTVYFGVQLKNSLVSNGEIVVGDTQKLEINADENYLKESIERLKKDYEIFSVNVK